MSWVALLERRWFPWLLVLAWAIAYLPHLGSRDLRLEEGRRATPAREMLDTGEWVKPTLYGDAYLNKPPLFFWVVALASLPFGEVSPLTVRLPSALSALGCALVALRFAPLDLGERARRLAALLVLASSTLLDKGTLGEIDPFLTLLIVLSLKYWWDSHRLGERWRGWSIVGLLIGLSVLTKGPIGPLMFYGTIVPFLLWTRQWRALFAWGHFLALGVMVLPLAIWLGLLVRHPDVPDLLAVWSDQLGFKAAGSNVTDPTGNRQKLLSHYLEFPLQIMGMFFPGSLWLVVAIFWRRSFAAQGSLIRRFLGCAAFVPTLAFYLYPESRPRHTMASFFGTAMFVAVLIAQWPTLSAMSQRWLMRLRVALTCVPFLLAIGVWPAHFTTTWVTLPEALLVSVASMAVFLWWMRINRASDSQEISSQLAIVLALNCLFLWGVVNTIVFPKLGERMASRFATQAVAGQWSPDDTIYTTLTFANSQANYYNMQFHLARRLDGIAHHRELLSLGPCIAIVTPREHADLEKQGATIELLANLNRPNGPPEVHVIRLHGPAK